MFGTHGLSLSLSLGLSRELSYVGDDTLVGFHSILLCLSCLCLEITLLLTGF